MSGPEGGGHDHGGGPLGRTVLIAACTMAASALAGWGAGRIAPAAMDAAGVPTMPLWLVAPFLLILLSIAVMPLAARAWWLRHFQDIALGLGAFVVAYYLTVFTGATPATGGASYGWYKIEHTAFEFLGFMGLIGSLYVVSGCILIDVRGKGGPGLNTALLAFGALLANFVGTTGASMLLIRPFLRVNHGRLRPIHVVFFIFIVSNCGGAVTPIGDPPLYLGYLVGVPFMWTVEHLAPHALAVVGALLVVFFALDSWFARRDRRSAEPASAAPPQPLPDVQHVSVGLRGIVGLLALPLIVGAIFIGPSLDHALGLHTPVSTPALMILVGALAYAFTPGSVRAANHFSWFPICEVALLFAGIFATMMPALAYLAEHGHQLGVTTPRAFYFATGALSAVLDNAPTYLNFLQVAMAGQEMTPANVQGWLNGLDHPGDLIGISTGAVFFGAMTYIGNGPNFMVKSIAEQFHVKMPSFFGYLFIACVALLPILIAHAWMVR